MAKITKASALHVWTGRIQSIQSLILNIAAGGWSKEDNARDMDRILFECDRLANEAKAYQQQVRDTLSTVQ